MGKKNVKTYYDFWCSHLSAFRIVMQCPTWSTLIDLTCMYNLSSIDQSIHRRLHVWNTYLGTEFCNLQYKWKRVGKEKKYILNFCTKIKSFFFCFVFWTDETFFSHFPAQVWITSKPFEKNFQNQFVRRCLILTLVVYSSTSTSSRDVLLKINCKKVRSGRRRATMLTFQFYTSSIHWYLPVYWLLCINEL